MPAKYTKNINEKLKTQPRSEPPANGAPLGLPGWGGDSGWFNFINCKLYSNFTSMWNDTDIPLAYLITFRTYGTWLHGDERGSVNRFRNQHKTQYLPPNEKWVKTNIQRLKSEPVKLNARQRKETTEAIRYVCNRRRWELLAVNVRTNHVHSVVVAQAKSGIVLNALKANATRRMREAGCWDSDQSPWVDKGSKRNLWNERSIGLAIEYVLYGQGDDLPDFD